MRARAGAGRARLENRISKHLARERRGVVLAELLVRVRQRQRGAVHAPVLAAGELRREDMLVTRLQPGCSPTPRLQPSVCSHLQHEDVLIVGVRGHGLVKAVGVRGQP